MMSNTSLEIYHTAQKYDPIKRREYYLRTRELKGRSSAGSSDLKSARSGSSDLRAITSTDSKEQARIAQRKKKAENVRVARSKIGEIREKLAKIQTHLKNLRAQQKKVESTQKAKPTAVEKKKSSDASKDYYQKNKVDIAAKRRATSEDKTEKTQKEDSVEVQIEKTEKRVEIVKARLSKAIDALTELENS